MKFGMYLSLAVLACLATTGGTGCDQGQASQPQATSGVGKAEVQVPTDPDGRSIEQKNIINRLLLDNKPGSIKHLYVISAMSGQVLLYSTVKGKVTSSGKRLSPTSTWAGGNGSWSYNPIPFNANGTTLHTTEMIQDDGTYGSSIEYVFWWDVRGAYHQHYVSGGQILHISDQPIAVKDVILNLEEKK